MVAELFKRVHFPEHIENINSSQFTFKYHRPVPIGSQIINEFEDGCQIEVFFCGVRLPVRFFTVEDANSALEKFIKRYNNLYDTPDGKGGHILSMIVKRLNMNITGLNMMCEDENIYDECDMIQNARVMNVKRIIEDMKYIIGTMLWFSDSDVIHDTIFALNDEKIC